MKIIFLQLRLGAMSSNLRLLAISVISVVLAACTVKGSFRPTVNLQSDNPAPNTVQAWGYPSLSGVNDDSVYYSLGVSLLKAAPFRFTFPDGHKAGSRELDAATLAAHLAPIERNEKGLLVSRLSTFNGAKQYSVVFTLGASGVASSMWLYACNVAHTDVLGMADDSKWFDFPIRQREIVELFGASFRQGHDFVIIGSECDSYDP